MKLIEQSPDVTLAAALRGAVTVQVSANKLRTVGVYSQAEQPHSGLGEEFITLYSNGVIERITRPIGGLYRGVLALAIWCKGNADGTAKRKRISAMAKQCIAAVHGKRIGGYYYEIDASNVVTPTTMNLQNGYATLILNVEWHN